jgi:hypothetical protein
VLALFARTVLCVSCAAMSLLLGYIVLWFRVLRWR